MMTALSGAIGSPGNFLGNTGVPDGADGATTTDGATNGATDGDGATTTDGATNGATDGDGATADDGATDPDNTCGDTLDNL
ncbi:hypothetical protein THAOC_12819 [Thalassiosira oceanica]|uniref:Uncharacterized protein n=1 Tax=Thalassiosira oceanica TaxID=159749 RepID=K0SMQ8_THAOC|nr:hypothetical protein THAOC_12819 [Thalassiosira oceanica]|eukprot:EJK66274.1 hypothetical protein THAOC_12819 [Thalassiosira oceanica]